MKVNIDNVTLIIGILIIGLLISVVLIKVTLDYKSRLKVKQKIIANIMMLFQVVCAFGFVIGEGNIIKMSEDIKYILLIIFTSTIAIQGIHTQLFMKG